MNTNIQPQGLADNAMRDLKKFMSIAGSNEAAMAVFENHLENKIPAIDATRKSDGLFYFHLNPVLATFLP